MRGLVEEGDDGWMGGGEEGVWGGEGEGLWGWGSWTGTEGVRKGRFV